MTPAQLKALLDAATPEPWRKNYSIWGINAPDGCYVASLGWTLDGDGGIARREDIDAIVALRNLAPLLLRLWEAVARDSRNGIVSSKGPHKGQCDDDLRLNVDHSHADVLRVGAVLKALEEA